MDISDLKDRFLKLDKELLYIMKEIRKTKSSNEDVIEKAVGAWGYNVDSKDFVTKLRHSKRPPYL